MPRFTAMTPRDVDAIECESCREAVAYVRLGPTVERLGCCGLASLGPDPAHIVFVLTSGLRPRLRILAWHQERPDRAFLDTLIDQAPRWTAIEVRGGYHEHFCRQVSAQVLQRWGFVPLGTAPDAWWRLDRGPIVRVRRWAATQWDRVSLPSPTVTDPVTPRSR